MTYKGDIPICITTHTLSSCFFHNNTLEAKEEKYPTPAEIKAKLILKGVRQNDIAHKLRVSEAAVSRVISGIPCSNRIRAEIALRIGSTPEKIWAHYKCGRHPA